MTFGVVRNITNGDGVTDAIIVGVFGTHWEAENATRIFAESHPTNVVGEAQFFVAKGSFTLGHPFVTMTESA
jgi:hypothetical protein